MRKCNFPQENSQESFVKGLQSLKKDITRLMQKGEKLCNIFLSVY